MCSQQNNIYYNNLLFLLTYEYSTLYKDYYYNFTTIYYNNLTDNSQGE